MNRVTKTPGAIWSQPRPAAKRRKCDGHLTATRHYIEPGELVVWSALPPNSEIGNENWWHLAFCSDCAPDS